MTKTFKIDPPFVIDRLGSWGTLCLIQLANNTALRFGSPVFLVGSALTTSSPTDLDIIMVLFDNRFNRIIGTDDAMDDAYFSCKINGTWRRYLKFQLKRRDYFESGMRSHRDIEIDFKVERFNRFYTDENEGRPKQRLDFFNEFF